MSKKVLAVNHRASIAVLGDADWLTVFAALLNDSHAESRDLARKLLARSKHGRQVRLLKLMRDRSPTLKQMAHQLSVSRRTVFRYLNDLEEYGVKLELTPRNGYRIEKIPPRVQRLL